MLKRALCTLIFSICGSHAWGYVPTQLVELDSFARPIVLKRFIEVAGVTSDNVFYRNFLSSVGKYSSEQGDFKFSAEIVVNETVQKTFQCEVPFVVVERDQTSSQILVNERHLKVRTKCKEIIRE